MPAQPITPTFQPRTDPFVLFPTTASFNQFIASLQFTISYTNLPDATVNTPGGVEVAVFPAYVATNITLAYEGLASDPLNDGNIVTVLVPSKASFDELVTKFQALSTQVAALQAALIAAGSGANA